MNVKYPALLTLALFLASRVCIGGWNWWWYEREWHLFFLRCEELKDFLREKTPWTLLGDSRLIQARVCWYKQSYWCGQCCLRSVLQQNPEGQSLSWKPALGHKRGPGRALWGGGNPSLLQPLHKDPKDCQLLELCLHSWPWTQPRNASSGARLKAFAVIRFIVLPLVKKPDNYNLSFFCEESGQPGDMR